MRFRSPRMLTVVPMMTALAGCGDVTDARVERTQALLPELVLERVTRVPVRAPQAQRVRIDVSGVVAGAPDALLDEAHVRALFTAASADADDAAADAAAADVADDATDADVIADANEDDAAAAAAVVDPILGQTPAGGACRDGYECVDFTCYSAGVHDGVEFPGTCSSTDGIVMAPGACHADADCGGGACDLSTSLTGIGSSMTIDGLCIGDTTFYPGRCVDPAPL